MRIVLGEIGAGIWMRVRRRSSEGNICVSTGAKVKN